MHRRAVALTVLFLLSSFVASLAQQRGATTAPPPAAPAPQIDPEIQKLEHAAEVQATADQSVKFQTMLSSTRLAQRQARDLARLAASSTDSVELTHRATTLEDSVDQALTDYRSFRRSLAEQQEMDEKRLMKRLIKAAHRISKDADAMSQLLQRVPLEQRNLTALAEHLERELSGFQAAQGTLAKEMGIDSQ